MKKKKKPFNWTALITAIAIIAIVGNAMINSQKATKTTPANNSEKQSNTETPEAENNASQPYCPPAPEESEEIRYHPVAAL